MLLLYLGIDMLKHYLEFLDELMLMLDKYFKSQEPYLCCKEGCSKCCSNGDYPFSEVELEFLKVGFTRLDKDTILKILTKINKIASRKEVFNQTNSGETFTYECPFLIDDMCSVYKYRGIICRTFGLISLKEGAKMQIPFCAYEGLNYSNVLDKEKDMLMLDKMQELGITEEPKAYNIHYDFLTSDKVAHAYNFNYGKKGPLIELLLEDAGFKQWRKYYTQARFKKATDNPDNKLAKPS